MLEECKVSIIVEGKAKSKTEAMSHALAAIQREIFKKMNHLVVKAEPEKINVLEARCTEYTERFLYIFMPRKRQRYQITLEVQVHLKTIDPQNVIWENNH